MYVCMYVCMCVCMSVYLYICMYVCMCVCMYVCMYVCMCVSVYVCMYVCVYVCMCVCVYVCMYTSQSDNMILRTALAALFSFYTFCLPVFPVHLLSSGLPQDSALDPSLCDMRIAPSTSGQSCLGLEPAFTGITHRLAKGNVINLLVTPGEYPLKEAMRSPAQQAPSPRASPWEAGS